ncbi:pectinesterase inhibitor [Actinidia eriantha]|uniref:pectinesterase inhibitor n=1 Tax=Actinidia eriantha TaxID=165200 RepID=UPI00258F33FB|nr:pectinesterase inhibitor [Actinidia eriantha]
MAFSYCSSSLFVSLLLVILFISPSSQRPSVKAENHLISEICPKTRNPSLCLQALKSDPRSASKDLKGLGQFSIDIAEVFAKQTSKIIASLTNQATDPKLKGRYETCSENYSDAIDSLGQANQFLKSGDYNSLNIYASAAFDGAVTCEDSFEGPPDIPTQLHQADLKLEDLCDIILVISNLLPGSK